MGYTLEGLSSKITSVFLAVLQKMSSSMRYGIVTNSHIAFNYIHIKFWGVCDAMVLGMKTNLLMTSYSRLRNSQEVGPNCLWCLRITGVCFILFYFSQIHESGRSIISIKMIISLDIDKQLRYCNLICYFKIIRFNLLKDFRFNLLLLKWYY